VQGLGFAAVVDTVAGSDIALYETCCEVAAATGSRDGAVRAGGWVADPPTMSVSATSIRAVVSKPPASFSAGDWGEGDAEEVTMTALATAPVMDVGVVHPTLVPLAPVLASSCPGWVCYAEKTVPQALRHVSGVKSAQQITGAVLKHLLGSGLGLGGGDGAAAATTARRRVYHVSIQMCFDKKLEASRKDFWWETAATAEVDCVLTSGEVADMLLAATAETVGGSDSKGGVLSAHGALGGAPLPPVPPEGDVDARVAWVEAAMSHAADWESHVEAAGAALQVSSDGYSEAVARFLHRTRTGRPWHGPLRWTAGKNADFQEAVGEAVAGASPSPSTTPSFRVMTAYGFRNIQAVVNRLKRASGGGGAAASLTGVDFVEVMACPSGCVNGGGQVKPPPVWGDGFADAAGGRTSAGMRADVQAGKARLSALRAVLAARDRSLADSGAPPPLWSALFGDGRDGDGHLRGALTRTRYHHVPRMDGLTLAAKW